MKLNFFAFSIILLLIASSSILSRKIKKKSTLKSKSKLEKICKAITKENEADSKSFFPQDVQKEEATLLLANQQTKAARLFFYTADKNNKIKEHFSLIATTLNDIYANQVNGSKTNKTIIDILKDTRQASLDLGIRGSLDTTFSSFMSIFNSSGTVNLTDCDNTCMKNRIREMIENVISNIREKNAKGAHYLGFLGLLADLGGALNDSLNRIKATETESIDDLLVAAKSKAKTDFGINDECVQLSIVYYTKLSPDKYYNSGTKNRNKKTERGNCVVSNTDTKYVEVIKPRAGVLDVGFNVDEELKINKKDRLAHLQWPLQTVPSKLLTECKTEIAESKEPWAGHFSGTMYDLIVMQEILYKMKNKPITDDVKRIIAGVSAAFLISNGMHSAIEVSIVIKNYLEGTLTYENYMKGSCIDATKDVSSLIGDITK